MKSIGKIAQLERKNNKKSSSYDNIEDKSSTFELHLEDNDNKSRTSFDEMLNDSLKYSQSKHNTEKSMEIIVPPNLPKMNVKQLTLEPKCNFDDSDRITEMSRNSGVHTFTSTVATNSKHPVENKITDLSDQIRYFSVPRTIKKSVASEEDRCTNNKIMLTNIRG